MVPGNRGIEARKACIRIGFSYRGVWCRETINLPPTKANLKWAERKREAILHEIGMGTFRYRDHFPDSKNAAKFHPGALMTVKDALDDWLTGRKKRVQHSTFEDYSNSVGVLINRFGKMRVLEVTKADIDAWINEMELTPKRVNNLLIPLRGAFQEQFDSGVLDVNPMARVRNLPPKPGRKADPFTMAEIETVLSACTGQLHNFLRFMFWTGLQTGEGFGLKWDAVDWQKGVIRVEGSKVRGKQKEALKTAYRGREVKILPEAERALIAQKAHTLMLGEYVFHDDLSGKPWTTPHQLNRRWKPVLQRAKVRYRNPYQTRHTYASMLLTAGEDPMWVAQQMGHANTNMIFKVYGRWIPELRPDAGDKIRKLTEGKRDGRKVDSLG